VEAEDDSHESANIVTEVLSELEGLLTSFGDAGHDIVGDVGNFGHNDEKVLLDIIGDLVGGAGELVLVEAEVPNVGNGVDVAAGDALGDGHDVSNKGHHLVHVEFILNNHAEQLNDLFLSLLGQAGVVNLISLVETLLETLVETSGALENVVELILLGGLPNLGGLGGQDLVGGGWSERETSLNGGGSEEHGHDGNSDSFHLLYAIEYFVV